MSKQKAKSASHDYDRKCPVLGCENSTKSSNCRFFRFPRTLKEYGHSAKVWSAFTRRKNFKPNSVEVMCEVHFDPEWIKAGKKSKLWWLKPGAVPTIYFKNGETIEVPYDSETQQYYGPEATQLLADTEDFVTSQEEEVVKKRSQKIKRLKNLCRFCFVDDESAIKTVALSKLESFSINPEKLLDLVGVNSPVDLFSEIICEKCFKAIIEFDGYRKRCQKAQRECIIELEELDKKILEMRREKFSKPQKTSEVWFKVKVEDEFNQEFSDFVDSNENACDDVEMDYEDIVVKNEIKQESNVHKTTREFSPQQSPLDDTQEDHDDSNWLDDDFIEDIENEAVPKKKKVYKKDPIKQKRYTADYALRSFDCFWCQEQLKGYTAFKSHRKNCKRFVRCDAVGCGKTFNNQGKFNAHITGRHGMEKVTRYFCSVCNVNYQTTQTKFEEHCKKCIEENQFKEQKIECGICKQTFNSLQAFTAHKVFHGPDSNLSQMMQPKRGPAASDDKNKTKKPRIQVTKVKEVICDICGKMFGNPNKLRRHHVDVHFVDFKGDLYCCDLCPVAKPTRRLIYTHMKATHMIQEHPCEVCGKIFKNRELWRKHILIHDESKRSNFCFLCPHQPGYVTKSNLKKHHWKHHGGEQPARPFICESCDTAYALEHLLMRHKMKVHNL